MIKRSWVSDDVISVHCEGSREKFEDILGDMPLDIALFEGISEELKGDQECLDLVGSSVNNMLAVKNMQGIKELDNYISNALASRYLSEISGRCIDKYFKMH